MILRVFGYFAAVILILIILGLVSLGCVYVLDNWHKADQIQCGPLNFKELTLCIIVAFFLTWMMWVSSRNLK